jgi:hypothetical protein
MAADEGAGELVQIVLTDVTEGVENQVAGGVRPPLGSRDSTFSEPICDRLRSSGLPIMVVYPYLAHRTSRAFSPRRQRSP